MGNFTFEEKNLLCIYNTGSRSGLIDALTEMRGELSPEEAELRKLTDSALEKLQAMGFLSLWFCIGTPMGTPFPRISWQNWTHLQRVSGWKMLLHRWRNWIRNRPSSIRARRKRFWQTRTPWKPNNRTRLCGNITASKSATRMIWSCIRWAISLNYTARTPKLRLPNWTSISLSVPFPEAAMWKCAASRQTGWSRLWNSYGISMM